MTDRVDLLPLPDGYDKYDPPLLYEGQMFNEEQMQDYARANVLHHTATLQAEIERLRAEVSELRAARIAYASEFPEAEDGGPDTESIHANIRSLKARAERLAEALRLIESAKDRGFGIDYARGVAQSVLLYDQEKGHEQ